MASSYYDCEPHRMYSKQASDIEFLSKKYKFDEVGINFNSEIFIDDKTSISTNKDVVFSSPSKAYKTYLKVMEVRDITEAERKCISKAKLLLQKLFEVFFRNSKTRIYLFSIFSVMFGYSLSNENYLAGLVNLILIFCTTSPIKFVHKVSKILRSNQYLDKLKKEINNSEVLRLSNLVDEDEDIKLYLHVTGINEDSFSYKK